MAPALFDRIEPSFQSGYSPDEINAAMRFVETPDFPAYIKDSAAAMEALKSEGPVSILGFCLGGTVAYAAACNLPELASAVWYYGGHIVHMIGQQPKCSTLMHFGKLDEHIPQTDVEKIEAACTECEIHVYEGADHGFNCDERCSYNKEAANFAWKCSLDLLGKHAASS